MGTSKERLAEGLSWSLSVLIALGLVTRVGLKDRFVGLDALYYALPYPVLIALLAVAAGLWFVSRRRLRGALSLVVAVVLMPVWYAQNHVRSPCVHEDSSFEVLFWNVGRGRGGWDTIVSKIQKADADIIAVVEAGFLYPDPVSYWGRRFPGYSVSVAPNGLVVMARGEVSDRNVYELGKRSWCEVVELDFRGRRLRVVVVDIEASLLIRRRDLFREVNRIVGVAPHQPTLLMGDFNTPGSSIWFDRLREDYSNLFEESGTGFLATWPTIAPILAIDHIWLSSQLESSCVRKEMSSTSDHTMLLGEISFGI